MKNRTSQGKCNLCGKTYSKSGMTRHLSACIPQHLAAEAGAKRKRAARRFHLAVSGAWATDYWMHLDVSADATLADLDNFLRMTWLECCGHLSAFTIEGIRYDVQPVEEWADRAWDFEETKDMRFALAEVLRPKMKFKHEYDFGTTTELTLRVVSERPDGKKRKPIEVLARNDPPEIVCQACGKNPATDVCVMCIYDGGGWLCDECVPDHDCGEEYFLPVVNSPRVGMCGYTG